MEFVSTRELRLNPGPVLHRLQEGEREAVVTSHGKPIALLVGVGEDDVEDTLRLVRQARAQLAVSRMRAQAREQGADALSEDAIADEIAAARASRRSR